MSIDAPIHFVKQFGAGIDLLQQQMGSNLRVGCDVDTNVTPGDRKFYDQLDAIDMVDITDRHGDTNILDVPHLRRMVTPAAAEWAAFIDRADLRRVLNDPQNGYVMSAAAAAGRKVDDKISAAFFGSADTGVDGGTPVTFPAGQQVAVDVGGLAIDQIREAREILEANENPEDGDRNRWYAALSALQRRDLLATTEVTSSDFNTIRALVAGQVNEFVGFTFLKSERLPVDSGPDRLCPFWRKSSMKVAIAQEGRSFIDEIPTKRHSIQVRYELDSGATRMDEKGVVEVTCDETP